MQTTVPAQSLALFAITGKRLPSQLGRATLDDLAELHDAMRAVWSCCSLAYSQAGFGMPEHRLAVIEPERKGTLSVARAVRILALWQKWTHSESFPSLLQVESFINGLRSL